MNRPSRTVRNYRDLIAWQKGEELAVEVYALSDVLIARKHYELSSQLRRAALSVSGNVAEGSNRCHRREFAQAVCIARASACEVESHLIVANRVKALSVESAQPGLSLCDEISRILATLRKRLI